MQLLTRNLRSDTSQVARAPILGEPGAIPSRYSLFDAGLYMDNGGMWFI